jgi:hypothetical protein
MCSIPVFPGTRLWRPYRCSHHSTPLPITSRVDPLLGGTGNASPVFQRPTRRSQFFLSVVVWGLNHPGPLSFAGFTVMEVFRVSLDVNHYRRFLPTDSGVFATGVFEMACQNKLPVWRSPPVYVFNPMLKAGNFYHLCSGAFVVDPVGLETLRTILEMAGELLPLPHGGSVFHLMNVLECVNCLDQEKTQWVYGKRTNARIGIKEYHFHAHRFSESTLFKIPETARGELLTVSGLKDPDDEFKSVVEREGLEGIIFEEVWSGSR